jgi:hypothetical protein
MNGHWVNQEHVSTSDVFETLHEGLNVKLISTRREDLTTCGLGDAAGHVMERNTEHYDFLPVVEPAADDAAHIVGLFCAEQFFDSPSSGTLVEEHFVPLSENFLIGADASILDFVVTADARPCRLVVSGGNIVGLVSLSDLQRLPARAALFALITGFEMTMAEAIGVKLQTDNEWQKCLSEPRREKIKTEIAKSRKCDGFVNALLFTQFADKATIIRKAFELPMSNLSLGDALSKIRSLRDNLAHANEYAATQDDARNVCATVRNLLKIRAEIAACLKK